MEDELQVPIYRAKKMNSEKRVLHPLLNPNSTHYEKDGEKPSIYHIECEMTISELVGACKFNIKKYQRREKGQNESDNKKIKTYQDYMEFLNKLINKVGDGNARELIDRYRIDIVYSEKELRDDCIAPPT